MKTRWSKVKLGRFLKQNTKTETVEPDKLYRLLGVRLERKGPYVREEKLGSQISAKKLQRVRSGDFIYSRLFAWRGAFGLIPADMDGAYVSNEFPNFRIEDNKIYPKFLELFFKQRRVWNEVEKLCTGTTKLSRNRFKEKFFLDFEILLPPLLEEQKRIVDRIESLLVRVEEARKLRAEAIEEANLLPLSILKYAFEGKFTEEWRKTHKYKAAYREHILNQVKKSHQEIQRMRKESGKRTFESLKPLDYEDLPKIPANWVWVRFEEVVYVIDYRGRTPPYSSEGVPHLRSSNIRDGEIIWDDLKYVSKTTYQDYMVRGLPKKSDLLFTTEAPLGEVAFVPEEQFSVAQRIIILRPTRGLLNPNFLFYLLHSERFRRQLIGRRTGTVVTGVPYRNLREIHFPLPPLPEQECIANWLDFFRVRVDDLKRLLNETEKEIEELIPSILDKAFNGEL